MRLAHSLIASVFLGWSYSSLAQLPPACPTDTQRTYYHQNSYTVTLYCVTVDGRAHGPALTMHVVSVPAGSPAQPLLQVAAGTYLDGLRVGLWWETTRQFRDDWGSPDSTVTTYVNGLPDGPVHTIHMAYVNSNPRPPGSYTLEVYEPYEKTYLEGELVDDVESGGQGPGVSYDAYTYRYTYGINPQQLRETRYLHGQLWQAIIVGNPASHGDTNHVTLATSAPPGSLARRTQVFLIVGADTVVTADTRTNASGAPDGPFIYRYPSGQIEWQGAYRNGIPDGTWRFYTQAGKLFDTLALNGGSGHWRHYRDLATSDVDEEGDLLSGRREGLWTFRAWDAAHTRELTSRQLYRLGQPISPAQCDSMYPTGCEIGQYYGGVREGRWISWLVGQRTEDCTYFGGLPWGSCRRWGAGGHLTDSAALVSGTGVWLTYDPSVDTAAAGLQLVSWVRYFGGVRDGQWRSYDDKGQVTQTGAYRGDAKVGQWSTFVNGEPQTTQNFVDGKEEGIRRVYSTSGGNATQPSNYLVSEREFHNGRPTGRETDYSPLGRVFLRATVDSGGTRTTLVYFADSGSRVGMFTRGTYMGGDSSGGGRFTGVKIVFDRNGDTVGIHNYRGDTLSGFSKEWNPDRTESREIAYNGGWQGLTRVQGSPDFGFPISLLSGTSAPVPTPPGRPPQPPATTSTGSTVSAKPTPIRFDNHHGGPLYVYYNVRAFGSTARALSCSTDYTRAGAIAPGGSLALTIQPGTVLTWVVMRDDEPCQVGQQQLGPTANVANQTGATILWPINY
jgi:antitoxin component YwqK of YwqJK toxin-antitoxin module